MSDEVESEVEAEGEDDERDPAVVERVLRRRVLRALVPVVRKLDRQARGVPTFVDDHERHACIALARLGAALIGRAAVEPEDQRPCYHPSHTPERAAELLLRLHTRHALAAASTDASDDVTNTKPAEDHS